MPAPSLSIRWADTDRTLSLDEMRDLEFTAEVACVRRDEVLLQLGGSTIIIRVPPIAVVQFHPVDPRAD